MGVWTQRSDEDPLFRVQGYSIRVTEFLLLLYIGFFVAEALVGAGTGAGAAWLGSLRFATPEVIGQGKVWQVATYPLINPVNFWFAAQMLVLYWCGREVEQAIGRRSFLFLYASLVAVPALVLVGFSLISGAPIVAYGSGNVHLALFVAFAMLFPDAELYFGSLLARWVAVGLVAIQSLIDISHRDWVSLAMLGCGVGVAAIGVHSPFRRLTDWIDEWRERGQTARRQQQAAARRLVEEKRNQSIDPILEKISREGLPSLTRDERARLERARVELLKRDGKAG